VDLVDQSVGRLLKSVVGQKPMNIIRFEGKEGDYRRNIIEDPRKCRDA
jgi:hypothetical protein